MCANIYVHVVLALYHRARTRILVTCPRTWAWISKTLQKCEKWPPVHMSKKGRVFTFRMQETPCLLLNRRFHSLSYSIQIRTWCHFWCRLAIKVYIVFWWTKQSNFIIYFRTFTRPWKASTTSNMYSSGAIFRVLNAQYVHGVHYSTTEPCLIEGFVLFWLAATAHMHG